MSPTELQAACGRYAALWNDAAAPPDLLRFLRDSGWRPDEEDQSLATELVRIDLLRRWERNESAPDGSFSERPTAFDYATTLYGDDSTPSMQWVLAEATARERSGEINVAELIQQRYQLPDDVLGQLPGGMSDFTPTGAGPVDTVAYSSDADGDGAGGVPLIQPQYLCALLGEPSAPEFLASFDRYDVQSLLGRGGMGMVLRAIDRSLQRDVAIKVLSPDLASDELARARFEREAYAAAAIGDHENVVTIHAVGDIRGLPYLVMRYVSGGTLQHRLDLEGPLPEDEVRRIGIQTARALEFSHRKGLVHRDVKPSNILIDDERDHACLADFGLARASGDSSLTTSGTILGTAQYMAPEQATGDSIDERTDLYCLGAVLYAMATGQPPFVAESPLRLIRMVCEEPPRPFGDATETTSHQLRQIIDRLLSKSPDDRVQTAREVAELLENWDRSAAVVETTELELNPALSRRATQGWTTTASIAVALGIDYGTTALRASWIKADGAPTPVLGSSGQIATPAIVVLGGGRAEDDDSGEEDGGEQEAVRIRRPAALLASPKHATDPAGKIVPAEALSALLLNGVVHDSASGAGAFDGLWCALPPSFGAARREALQRAFEIASLGRLETVSTTTAAALDFAFQRGWLAADAGGAARHLLVVCTGANNFDAAAIRLLPRKVQTLATIARPDLAVDAWAQRLRECVVSLANQQFGDGCRIERKEAARAQARLGDAAEVEVVGRRGNQKIRVKVDRTAAGDAWRSMIGDAEEAAQSALREGRLGWDDIDNVLIAGGAAAIPPFRALFKRLSPKPGSCMQGSESAAANGAAIEGLNALQSGRSAAGFELIETTPFDYEVRRRGSKSKTVSLTSRGAVLPASASFFVTAGSKKRSGAEFEVLEIARPVRRVVARCRLTAGDSDANEQDLPPAEIIATVGRDGLLNLTLSEAAERAGYTMSTETPDVLKADATKKWRAWLHQQTQSI